MTIQTIPGSAPLFGIRPSNPNSINSQVKQYLKDHPTASSDEVFGGLGFSPTKTPKPYHAAVTAIYKLRHQKNYAIGFPKTMAAAVRLYSDEHPNNTFEDFVREHQLTLRSKEYNAAAMAFSRLKKKFDRTG